MIAVVIEDFRTWSARSRIAHRPEIIAGRDADDTVVGKAGDLLPEVRRIIIRVVDGDEKLVL